MYLKIFSYKRTLFVALLIFIICIIRLPSSDQASFPNLDKIVHFFMFALLTIVFMLENRDRIFFIPLLIFSVYGAFIEFVQYFLPYRSADFYDWLSDFLGVFVVLIFYVLFRK